MLAAPGLVADMRQVKERMGGLVENGRRESLPGRLREVRADRLSRMFWGGAPPRRRRGVAREESSGCFESDPFTPLTFGR